MRNGSNRVAPADSDFRIWTDISCSSLSFACLGVCRKPIRVDSGQSTVSVEQQVSIIGHDPNELVEQKPVSQ